MPDVLTLSADFALDVMLMIPEITVGGVMRATDVYRMGRSRSINLARILRELGHDAEIGGFLAGTNGKFIEQQLEQEGFHGHYVWCEGETPQNLIVTEQDGHETALNEQGLEVEFAHFQKLAAQIKDIGSQFKWVSFSGKVPSSTPPEFYATLLDAASPAKAAGDTEGEVLAVLARRNLDLLCITAGKASGLLGWPIESIDDAQRACQELQSWGNALVIIHLGRKGVVACNEQECWHASIPNPAFIDSLAGRLAGTLDALIIGESLDNVLRRGIAARELARGHSNRMDQIVLKQLR